MRTLSFLPLIFSMLFVLDGQAQVLRFRVINSGSWTGIEHVEVKSTLHNPIYTDAFGHFELLYSKNDTLVLNKPNYHSIYYVIEAKNFDSSHTISLSMTPLSNNGNSGSTAINTLQKFDYHFVHDANPDTSYVKIHVMESLPAVKDRTKLDDKDFQLKAVPLNHISIHPKSNGSNSYKLNDD